MWLNPARPERWRCGLAALLCTLWLGAAAAADDAPATVVDHGLPASGGFQVALVTYGPGERYWERYGHNALWLREPALGLDHAFNYGFFDFNQENFLLRFVQGRMLYFSAQVPAAQEMAFYQSEGRSIRVQVLDLAPEEYQRLRNHLLHHAQPAHRQYLYDYYLDNCSTRLRDALDIAIGGDLAHQFSTQPAPQSFRDHTRRGSAINYWYYLGLEAALGLPVDRPVSRWDEMFLPAALADGLVEVDRLGEQGLAPLVRDDQVLSPAMATAVPDTPPSLWLISLALGIGLSVLLLVAARWAPPVLAQGLSGGWLLISGSLGWGMLLVWGFTDHAAGSPNLNLLLLNPLAVVGLWPGLRRVASVLLLVGSGLGLILQVAWGAQYQWDVLALAGVFNVAVAAVLWRMGQTSDR